MTRVGRKPLPTVRLDGDHLTVVVVHGLVVESGKRQESIQHGLFLERLIVVAAKLAIESVAKLAAGAEVASKKEVTGD